MDRNLVVAILLSVVIIIGFQLYYKKEHPPPPQKHPTTTEESMRDEHVPRVPDTARQPSAAPGATDTAAPAPAPRVSDARTGPVQSATPEKQASITIDTPQYEAVLTSVGARIISFKLKKYKKSEKGDSLVDLFESERNAAAGPTIRFTKRDEIFNDSGFTYRLDANTDRVVLKEKGAKKTVTFKTTTTNGLTISKVYTFHAEGYMVDFSFTLTNNRTGHRDYLVTLPLKKVYRGETAFRPAWDTVEIFLNNSWKNYYFGDTWIKTGVKDDEELFGKVAWAGLGDVYFFQALVFGDKPAKRVGLFKRKENGLAEIRVRVGAVDLPHGQPVTQTLSMYLGPKDKKVLAAAGHNLSAVLYYSDNSVLGPVLNTMAEWLMKFLEAGYTGVDLLGIRIPGTHNWGINIIILTIIIKILFIPLTHKSMKSMKRMQGLQPQMAKFKEKYKDDRQAMNRATMELFREHKVSPLGGCWPMLLQFPVFIALYEVLAYAIEMRHSPFVWYITDLSAPDPYYVTPILMGGAMVLQQWMTPSTGDPTQRKMMMMMPVVFTFMFLQAPSGLVIYWLVNNVLSIGQQYATNRMAD